MQRRVILYPKAVTIRLSLRNILLLNYVPNCRQGRTKGKIKEKKKRPRTKIERMEDHGQTRNRNQ